MAFNGPGIPSNGIPRSRARVILVSIADLAAAQRGVASPENVDPMTDITLLGVVVADEDVSLVLRGRIGVAVLQFNEMVLQHPIAPHRALERAATRELPSNAPLADE